MNKTKITIIVLVATFVLSNAWLAFRLLDAGVTISYMQVSLDDNKKALGQTLALLPVVAQPGVTREDILSTAKLGSDKFDSFEKDGFLWIGSIGIKFSDSGQLVEVKKL